MRADRERINIFFFEALTAKLQAGGGRQIQEIFSRALWMGPEDIERKARRFKSLPHVLPYFITSRPDAGAHSGEKRRRLAAVMGMQFPDRAFGDPLLCAPPAAVNGGNDAPGFIHKKERWAVRRFDDQKNSGQRGGQGIPFRPLPGNFIDELDFVRMNLVQPDNFEITPISAILKIPELPIFGSEAMDQPGNPVQSGDRQIFFHLSRTHLLR